MGKRFFKTFGEIAMKRLAQDPLTECPPKLQQVSCPCCKALLALHFIRGQDEVYDIELISSGTELHQEIDESRHKLEELGGETSSHFQPSERTSGELLSDQTDGSPSHTGDLKQVIEARARKEIERSGVHCQTVVKDEEERGATLRSPEHSSSIVDADMNDKLLTSNRRYFDSAQARTKAEAAPSPQAKKDASGTSKLFPLFYRSKKTVHIIRHGQTSLWAVPEGAEGMQYKYDLRLTPLGQQQASNLAPKMAALKPDLILVSPLRRALETVQRAFPHLQEGRERVEVTHLLTEHVSCSGDIGRPPEVLAKEFPWLSFDSLPEVWWYSHPEFPNDAIKMAFNSTEPMDFHSPNIEHIIIHAHPRVWEELVRKRVGIFRQFLLEKPENVIVVVGHSTFFKEFTSTRRRMKNCEIQTFML